MRGLLRIVMVSVLLIGAVPKAGAGSITSIHPAARVRVAQARP